MNFKASNSEYRSLSHTVPPTYLSLLLSVGTSSVSVAGLVLLGESAAFAYSSPSVVEDFFQNSITNLAAKTAEATVNDASSRLNVDTIAGAKNSTVNPLDIVSHTDRELSQVEIDRFDLNDQPADQVDDQPVTQLDAQSGKQLVEPRVESLGDQSDAQLDNEITEVILQKEQADLSDRIPQQIPQQIPPQTESGDIEPERAEPASATVQDVSWSELLASDPTFDSALELVPEPGLDPELDTQPESDHNAETPDLVEQFDRLQAQFLESNTLPTDTQLIAPFYTNADVLLPIVDIAQPIEETSAETEPLRLAQDTDAQPNEIPNNDLVLQLQGVYLLDGDDSSARARVSGSYAFSPNVLVGATIDLTTGDAFTDSEDEGLDLNELYVTVSPSEVPGFRVVLGMIDLTSYFDRNSFAKDVATHFFNPVFQTNPALASAGIGSRPGVLVNWDLTDNLSVRGAAFSSDRDLDDFALDGAAAEVALRLDRLIIRGTYATNRDAGQEDGFREIFQFDRGDTFGLQSGDREVAYGINAEYFIPDINLGLFARYGWYENLELDEGGYTYSVGANVLDLFFADDRLGLAYGRELSNDRLRGEDEVPDVLELFYDLRITPNLRAGVSVQQRDEFSETVLGLRVRADLDLAGLLGR